MSAYHQMGHNSRNLLFEQQLSSYRGAILSPVNDREDQMSSLIDDLDPSEMEIIFDPQLYYPNTSRGNLSDWAYFPSDVDTADQASRTWWSSIISKLSETTSRLRVSSVCSPAIVPRVHSLEYYQLNCEVALEL